MRNQNPETMTPVERDAELASIFASGLVRGVVPREMTKPNSPEFYPPDDCFRRGLIARGWTEAEIQTASA